VNNPDITEKLSAPNTSGPRSGSPADVIKMYVVEYEHGRNRFHTVVEARSIEAAKRQFRRDNPDVEMLSIV
jgi:hypothetical protein